MDDDFVFKQENIGNNVGLKLTGEWMVYSPSLLIAFNRIVGRIIIGVTCWQAHARCPILLIIYEYRHAHLVLPKILCRHFHSASFEQFPFSFIYFDSGEKARYQFHQSQRSNSNERKENIPPSMDSWFKMVGTIVSHTIFRILHLSHMRLAYRQSAHRLAHAHAHTIGFYLHYSLILLNWHTIEHRIWHIPPSIHIQNDTPPPHGNGMQWIQNSHRHV